LRVVGLLELNERRANLNLIARPDLALVDALSVDERSRLVAEIDEGDVGGRGDLDDRMRDASSSSTRRWLRGSLPTLTMS
jgi:hypothetical protein